MIISRKASLCVCSDLSCQIDVGVLPVGTPGQQATAKGTVSHPLDQSLRSGGKYSAA